MFYWTREHGVSDAGEGTGEIVLRVAEGGVGGVCIRFEVAGFEEAAGSVETAELD